jgi:hypothetical protein
MSLLLMISLTCGCSDDAKSNPKDAGDTGKHDASTSHGSNDGGDQGKADSGAVITQVACGSETCKIDPLLASYAAPCCAKESDGTCGWRMLQGGDGKCNPSVKPDTRCPSIDVMKLFTVPSCCTAKNRCGLDGSMFGMAGCTSLEDLEKQRAMLDAGTMANTTQLPAPRACNADDGGSQDAGH